MPIVIDGCTYYRTAEAFRSIGISRNTLYRWLQKGILTGVERRDSRGWRLFTQEEIDRLDKSINSITGVNS
ncbi:MAG: hypothetical protein A2Z15_08500 [Chloroflexi bacterium RBG_16_50_11]|nr:MAG: hypothetical protein A2Z15_08500 [Chloroflexi bacterium RBG_16_50_11]